MIRDFTDQLGNKVSISFPPQSIISLVPSQTELLADLGLEEKVSGITKFCVHPKGWLSTRKIIGGTKSFDFAAIAALSPDVIIGNKEENYREGIEKLQLSYPVWMSDIVSFQDALQMMRMVGEMTDTTTTATSLTSKIEEAFSYLQPLSHTRTVLYLIWRNPWMAAAGNTFIHTMMDKIGMANVLADQERYPQLSPEDIMRLSPDLIFLSSEPYPFKEKHIAELQHISPASKIVLVDGEMFSWPASRLLRAAPYFNSLIEQITELR